MSFGAEMRAGLDMHFTFSSNYFALDTIQHYIKVFYIREPGSLGSRIKKQFVWGKVPNVGGWGGQVPNFW